MTLDSNIFNYQSTLCSYSVIASQCDECIWNFWTGMQPSTSC